LFAHVERKAPLGLDSTNIREVTDYEPTDTAAVIKRALLLNNAAMHPPVLHAKRAASPLTSTSRGSKWRRLDRVDDPPFAVVIPLPHRAYSHSQQIMSNTLSTAKQMRASSSQYSPLHGRSTSHRPFTSSPPSQRALEALRHILQLKRQIRQSFSSAGPSAVLPSPSCSMRMPYVPPKGRQPKCPSNQPAESCADVVVAAINKSGQLSQGGSGRAPASTPLRVYKKQQDKTRRCPP
jgi:hypothetical protein